MVASLKMVLLRLPILPAGAVSKIAKSATEPWPVVEPAGVEGVEKPVDGPIVFGVDLFLRGRGLRHRNRLDNELRRCWAGGEFEDRRGFCRVSWPPDLP